MNTPPDNTAGSKRPPIPSTRSQPAPVVEKANYTMEEMMERLKNGDSGTGERGKKRRRRSEQPVKIKRTRRAIVLTCLTVAGFLAMGVWMGLHYAAKIRIEGEAFRESLNRRVSSILGVQIEMKRLFDSGGGTLTASEAKFEIRTDDLLEGGTAHDVSAALTRSSWVTDEWGITSLSMRDATLRFNPARTVFPNDTTTWVPVNKAAESVKGWRMGITAEPASISLDTIRLPSFTMELKLEGHDVTESINGLDGHIDVGRDGKMSGVFGKGVLNLNGWQPLKVLNLACVTAGRQLTVRQARVSMGETGTATLTGEGILDRSGSLLLQGKIDGISLPSFVPGALKDKLFGKISATEVEWRSKFFSGDERELRGKFLVENPVIRGLSFVKDLSDALRRPELIHMEFQTMSGNFRWTPTKGLELTEIHAEMKEPLKLEGSISIKGNSISGDMVCTAKGSVLANIMEGTVGGFKVTGEQGQLAFTLTGTPELLIDSIDLLIPGALDRPVPAVKKTAATPVKPTAPDAPSAPVPPTAKPSTVRDPDKVLEELLRK